MNYLLQNNNYQIIIILHQEEEEFHGKLPMNVTIYLYQLIYININEIINKKINK